MRCTSVIEDVFVPERDEETAAGPVVERRGMVAVVHIPEPVARVARQLSGEHQQKRTLVVFVTFLDEVLQPRLPVLRRLMRPHKGM